MIYTYKRCFLLLVFLLETAWLTKGFEERIFRDSGLVFILKDDGDHTRFERIGLSWDSWNLETTPVLKTIAMTEKGNTPFTFVDVDYDNRTLVAVDKSRKKIMAISFDDDDFPIYWQLFAGTSDRVNGIAVDWTTDVVYWTDAAYNAIFAASMANPNIVETIVEGLDEPYGIATHPRKGYLFWTDAGDRPKIMRSSLGGRRHRTVMACDNWRKPKTITIDYSENRLYWLYEKYDGGRQGIGSSDLYGNDHKRFPLSDGISYFDLDVFQGGIFLVSQKYKEIHVIRKASGERRVLFTSLQGSPYGLVILDRGRQFARTNPCLNSNCPGVCTRSNSSQDCFCNEEMKLTAEPEVVKRQCRDIFKGILLPKGDGIYSMVQNFAEFDYHLTIKPERLLESQHAIRAMTSDTRSMKIFYFESVTKIIKSVRVDHGSESHIVSYAVDDVGGMAVDGSSGNLYWTDQTYGHIMVAKVDGSYATKLKEKLTRPKAIAVHPNRMYLYWSDTAEMTLNRCILDGTYCQSIVANYNYTYNINDIAIDFKAEKLYWVRQGAESAVYESDLHGKGIYQLYSRRGSLFTGVAVMHDYIVVSDTSWRSGGLHAVDKISRRLVGKAIYKRFEYGNWFGVDFHHVSSEARRRTRGYDPRRRPCDQLYIPSNTSQRYTCFCSIGYSVNETDRAKCEIDSRYHPFVLLVDQRYQKVLQMNVVSDFVAVPLQLLKQPYALAVDVKMGKIYWSDLDTGTISRADLNGNNQEIVVAQPGAYFTSLRIDPENRLLYYLIVTTEDCKPGSEICGSLVACDIDKTISVILVDRRLESPSSLALNTKFGYGFLIDQGQVWRFDMNGSNPIPITDRSVRATLVVSVGEFIYFTNEIKYGIFYEMEVVQIMRSALDGQNLTLVVELSRGRVTSLAVSKDFLYWTNTSTRGVQRLSLTRFTRKIDDVGPAGKLFLPTDIFTNFAELADESVCSDMPTYCSGICLPSPSGPRCVDDDRIRFDHIEDSNKTKEFCYIPKIKHGEVIGQKLNLVVPHGFLAYVQCFPLHNISSKYPMRCYKGEWSHIPACTLEYSICGDEFRGYKVYTEAGKFFAYPRSTKVDVICIGGGGGGYDATNDAIVEAKKAGDGGNSVFSLSESNQLVAYGGKGGSLFKGGTGGDGHQKGGDGSASIDCTTGGTAGEYAKSSDLGEPGVSHHIFCGAGGYSDDCRLDITLNLTRRYAGPGGMDGNGSFAGQYGGGAGSRTGGTGGGGGYTRYWFTLSPKQVATIEIGEPGYPSYGQPGQGVCVITWGGLKIDEYVKDFDVVNECVLYNSEENDNTDEIKDYAQAKRKRYSGRN